MMTKQLMVMLALLIASGRPAAGSSADLYLSPRGSDDWSGTLSVPNAQGTDGPFASLERARDAVRVLKKRKSTDIVVWVREGTYRLEKTVVFGLEDSGKGDSTVTYAAYPGETPVFSSGREIKGWKKVTARLPGLPECRKRTVGHRGIQRAVSATNRVGNPAVRNPCDRDILRWNVTMIPRCFC